MTRYSLSSSPAPSLALPGLLVLLVALLAGLLACAGEPPASCGALGRVSSCPCPGGAQGAQECGPLGVWGACVCPGDAGGEVGADAGQDAVAVGDAGPEAMVTDAPQALDADAVAVADAGADAPPDAPRDASSDLPDAPIDRAPDRPDSSPDPLLEQVTAVRVTVTGAGVSWTSARMQSCTVSGGRVSVGAEFDAPEPGTFVAEGPVAGPVVFGTAFNSDVRGTVRMGAEYMTDGATVRRANFALSGTPRTERYEMIALGCVVR